MDVGGAGGAQPRRPGDERGECGIRAEALGDRVRVGVQVEEAAHPLGRGRQVPQVPEVQPALQPAVAGPLTDLGDAGAVRQVQGAPVGAVTRLTRHLLDAGEGARREVVEDPGRGVGAPVSEPQGHSPAPVGGADGAVAGGPAGPGGTQLSGGEGVDLAHRVVELPHAGEAGGERDLGGPQGGGLQQDPGGVGALGAGERDGPGTDLGVQLALDLAGAVAEARGEPGHPFPVDDPVADQPHRPADQVGARVPVGGAGHGVRAAAPAGTESSALGRGRGGEERHVPALRCGGRTARTAVDTGRGHGEEELAVEPGVATGHRLVPAVVAGHASRVRHGAPLCWRISDSALPVVRPLVSRCSTAHSSL